MNTEFLSEQLNLVWLNMKLAVKRVIDILGGLVGVLFLFPLTIIIKILSLKSGDKESIFFKQKRIGKNGKDIYIYKYRSMVPNAEDVLEKLMKENPKIKEEYLKNKKLKNDPRITKVGNFIRKTSLDEFPQFINVLKGDMSLVGPRPYLPREKDDMKKYYDDIIKVKPGITGPWQVNGRSDISFNKRIKMDSEYSNNWGIIGDFKILIKTVSSVLLKKGAK